MKIEKSKVKTYQAPVFKPAKLPNFSLCGCEKKKKK